jgi:hypothetical protein
VSAIPANNSIVGMRSNLIVMYFPFYLVCGVGMLEIPAPATLKPGSGQRG